MIRFTRIETKFRNSYTTDHAGTQWIVTWNDEGYWMVAYVTERGDLVAVDDAFSIKGAADLIEKTADSWG